jgi:hypothetical protein
MSVVIIQKEKEGFLRMFRQYLTFFNNTGILQGLKTNIYFVSKKKKKQEKRKKALRNVFIANKKNSQKLKTKKIQKKI